MNFFDLFDCCFEGEEGKLWAWEGSGKLLSRQGKLFGTLLESRL